MMSKNPIDIVREVESAVIEDLSLNRIFTLHLNQI